MGGSYILFDEFFLFSRRELVEQTIFYDIIFSINKPLLSHLHILFIIILYICKSYIMEKKVLLPLCF